MQFFQRLSLLFFLAGMLVLTGCKEEATLHSQLEERQANLVMAALLDAGIDCRKKAGEENLWNVIIDTKDFAAAVNLLESQGLPRRNYQGVTEVFKKSGMVSIEVFANLWMNTRWTLTLMTDIQIFTMHSIHIC